MMSKPVWSWLDALVIGVLLVAGTSAMVEARNRVIIGTPDTLEVADPIQPAAVQKTRLCTMTALTGDVAFIPYSEQIAGALTDAPLASCPN